MATITIPGTPSTSITIKDLDDTELAARWKANVAKFGDRAKSWKTAHRSLDVEQRIVVGVKLKMHVDATDPDAEVKKAQVAAALGVLETVGGLSLPNDKLEVYSHSAEQACLGFVLSAPGGVQAVMTLGTGVTTTRMQLVSTIIHDEYAKTQASSAADMRVRAAIMHEFGHIFHQLLAPSHYFALASVAILSTKTQGELAGLANYALFPDRPSLQEMKAFVVAVKAQGARVSEYAGKMDNLNEFVAEVFAGLAMGLSYDDDVMTTYQQLGGPPIDVSSKAKVVTRRRARAVVEKPDLSGLVEMGDGL